MGSYKTVMEYYARRALAPLPPAPRLAAAAPSADRRETTMPPARAMAARCWRVAAAHRAFRDCMPGPPARARAQSQGPLIGHTACSRLFSACGVPVSLIISMYQCTMTLSVPSQPIRGANCGALPLASGAAVLYGTIGASQLSQVSPGFNSKALLYTFQHQSLKARCLSRSRFNRARTAAAPPPCRWSCRWSGGTGK